MPIIKYFLHQLIFPSKKLPDFDAMSFNKFGTSMGWYVIANCVWS